MDDDGLQQLDTYPGHRFAVNVPDDASSVTVTLAMWSYDSRGLNEHTAIVVGSHTEYIGGVPVCVDDATVTLTCSLQAPGEGTSYVLRGCFGGSGLRADPLYVNLATIVPDRIVADLSCPRTTRACTM